MQTFLPYESFTLSARSLDRLRLGKQRIETMQILKILAGIQNGRGWINHPAVKMWEGSGYWLAEYGLAICEEWIARNYKDNCLIQIQTIQNNYRSEIGETYPEWLGNNQFHISHQSNLLRKNPEYYSIMGWNVPNDLPYYWPTQQLTSA